MANTLGTNLTAKIDDRVTAPIWLVKIATLNTTLYRTTWPANVSWDSQTWTPEAMHVDIRPASPNSSAEANVQLSGNTAALNFLLHEDLEGATVTIYETQGGITYSTNDVLLRFTGQVEIARSRTGYGEMKCINAFELLYTPNLYISAATWVHVMMPGTHTIGGRTSVLSQESY